MYIYSIFFWTRHRIIWGNVKRNNYHFSPLAFTVREGKNYNSSGRKQVIAKLRSSDSSPDKHQTFSWFLTFPPAWDFSIYDPVPPKRCPQSLTLSSSPTDLSFLKKKSYLFLWCIIWIKYFLWWFKFCNFWFSIFDTLLSKNFIL